MRNPGNPQRHSAANQRRTEERIATYLGVKALLDTWERQPEDVQIREHDYLLALRAKVRMNGNLVLHRSDPRANVL